ncbi:MAG: hypothetical protein KTR28_08145 [Micavibrio sp.]|nr:hypothetical protein [Micavibrio sp.]
MANLSDAGLSVNMVQPLGGWLPFIGECILCADVPDKIIGDVIALNYDISESQALACDREALKFNRGSHDLNYHLPHANPE